ncbi:aminoglycoside phosphotransferase family protein [Streptomyces venezuelae]|uniref:aminoglycoside phosphotransferase family protein n=1 Tax=Streptomyces venezuelae TaxID=54571 RepID=UPI0033324AA8
MDALALYRQALVQDTALAGFYHRNVRMESDGGPVLVRIRTGGSDAMDLTCWREPELLTAVGHHLPATPRLLHASRCPEFQIHTYIPGPRVDEVAADGRPVPTAVLTAVGELFTALLRIPTTALPPRPAHWPRDGETARFAGLLLDLVREIRHRKVRGHGLYAALGVPEDPCDVLAVRAGGLSRRSFRLLHADIHRANMIMADDGHVAFLDWELALWGDPVYDLADHVHKMSFTPADRQAVVETWVRSAPAVCRDGWRTDLDFYLGYETMKSAVVDTVRWGRLIRQAAGAGERHTLCLELAGKLAAARPYWGTDVALVTDPAAIEAAVHRCLD